ncbi:DUF1302 domain-containing protein [Panacagrimonas sp.]|uniref:DUF1302 domain-containing protein n=1 Tax=Panacagrimonas sp. TaxID=2480088 RepID=UPI003B51727F
MKTRKLTVLLRLGVGGLALALPLSSQALPFQFGPVQGSLDTTVSAGVTISTEDPDSSLIGIANGGTARTVNEDDGRLNYEAGDVISTLIKATHDLDIQYGSGGIFGRASYFYDFQADDDRDNFGERGRDRLVAQGDLLDLFAYVNFKINGHNASVRAGRQVVNWGESTFIGNSINAINAIDVARFRAPGSELREALLPHPMFWGSLSLTNTLSLESVWIWGFDEVEIDPRGSFFSTNDFISDDGDVAYTGIGRRNDQSLGTPVTAGNAAGVFPVGVPRSSTRHPDQKTGQYGVALRYFADWLNSTEFGLYYLKYHSRLPLISGVRASDQSSTLARVNSSTYFVDYPEGIELYGLSFNTDGPLGIALQGEYSYRPNLPVQLAATELLLAALRLPNAIDLGEGVNPATAEAQAEGFRRVKTHQAQMTATKAFGPSLGADQFILLGEAGVTRMELDKDLLYNGPSAHLVSCRNPAAIQAAVSNGSCQENVGGGYADRTSWGYRVVSRMDFESAIGAAQLSPRLVFSHDVNGVGPVFNQDTKAISVGLAMNYLQRWQADLAYTTFFDGRTYSGVDPIPPGVMIAPGTTTPGDPAQPQSFSTSANVNEDRDFLALSISYAF